MVKMRGREVQLRKRLATPLAVAALGLASFAALPTAASAAEPSVINAGAYGLKGGTVRIMGETTIAGSLAPWRPGQRVRLFVYRNGRQISTRLLPVTQGSGNWGTFRTAIPVRVGGRYAAQVRYYGHAGVDPLLPSATPRMRWGIRYPGLRSGQCGPVVEGFRKALNRMAFVPARSRCFNGKLERAVLAYRKLNGLGRSARAGKRIVERVFSLKGRYRVRRPDLGNHVEAPLSRQVMVFAKGRKPYAIFPIASGAPATPTILGVYSFYRKDPGYNAIGMYYSSYFIRGYAIHGYKSVPNYPASHGCLRTFIADQPRIYDLTEIGMPIYTFGNAFAPFRLAPDLPDPADFD